MRTTRKISKVVATAAIAIATFATSSAAHAATLTVTATSPGTIGATGTNGSEIVISATIATAQTPGDFRLTLPSGWTFVNTGAPSSATCPTGMTVTGVTPTGCGTLNTSPDRNAVILANGGFSANQPIVITFVANSLNVTSSRDFIIRTYDSVNPTQVVDSGTATLAGGSSPEPEPTPAPNPASNSSTVDTLAKTGTGNEFVATVGAALLLLAAGGAATLALRRRA